MAFSRSINSLDPSGAAGSLSHASRSCADAEFSAARWKVAVGIASAPNVSAFDMMNSQVARGGSEALGFQLAGAPNNAST